MFNRSLVIIFTTLFFIVFSAIAQAQSPEILKGVAYLASSQTSDGAWNNDTTPVETTSATATVLETLKILNQIADSSYDSGIAWLQSQTPQAVALVAQRILTLGLNDGSSAALLPALDSLRGAWGGYDGYAANTLDTAYALQALQSTNSTLGRSHRPSPRGRWG